VATPWPSTPAASTIFGVIVASCGDWSEHYSEFVRLRAGGSRDLRVGAIVDRQRDERRPHVVVAPVPPAQRGQIQHGAPHTSSAGHPSSPQVRTASGTPSIAAASPWPERHRLVALYALHDPERAIALLSPRRN
jgi:hypothetical protein